MDWQLRQSVATDVTVTDNEGLDPDNQKEAAIIPRVNYGLNGTGRGGRVLFATNTSLSLSAPSNQSELDFDQAIRAFGRAELYEDRLFLDATFSSTQELVDIGAATNGGTNSDTSSVTSFSISPVYQQRIGRWADAQAAYRHTEIFTTGDADEGSADSLQFVVASGNAVRWVKPSLSAAWFNYDETPAPGNSEDDIEQFSIQLANTIPITRNYAVLATLGYDDVNAPSSTRELGGVFWSVGITGRPGPRTQFSFQIGKRYDTLGVVGTASYAISNNLTLRFSASQDVGTGLQRSGTQVQRLSVNNQSGGLAGPNGLPPGFLRSDLDDGISTNQTFDIGLNGTYGRNTIVVGATADRREFDVGTENVRSARASFTRQLSQQFSGTVSGFYRYVDDLQGADTHAIGGRLTFNYRVGQRTTVFLTLSRTDRSSADATEEFSENAATIGGRITF